MDDMDEREDMEPEEEPAEQEPSSDDKPTVKLVGADGNAFNIIGLCMRAARQAGWPVEKRDQVRREMMSGDYNNVLATAMKYFDVE